MKTRRCYGWEQEDGHVGGCNYVKDGWRIQQWGEEVGVGRWSNTRWVLIPPGPYLDAIHVAPTMRECVKEHRRLTHPAAALEWAAAGCYKDGANNSR